ncbi:MAG: ORF6N domain-containing protein [Thiovulaceae bacterium]|nr:ORF6N domain-containing protein [Sulfurimonadaceae bacterium]
MGNNIEHIDKNQDIQSKIYTIRGLQVMLDRDLAILYEVETKRINEAVKNNLDKFPEDFYFELADEEFDNLRSKISTANFSKIRTNPKVFTEQGIYMLATILKSKVATNITLSIIRTFADLRKFLLSNYELFRKIETIEKRQMGYELKSDEKFEKLFEAIEQKELKPSYGIFYDGQMFDAYIFIADLIRGAKSHIVLIDNYIDDSVLTLFSKNQNIDVTIYTHLVSKQLKLDIEKYNSQYKTIKIKSFKDSHDRFMIIDNMEVYHIGASLKDLGRKWFAFSKIAIEPSNILDKLK